ncbi:hypothetical protein JB92DRAFT_2937972 [Gautieria morchelliformis]|nr:hypothetical protein JB92DRAFT_2937972 [Gautieria morchelliformis]
MSHVKSLVRRAVNNTPFLPRVSSKNLQLFCTDIALIALGFRTAYLLDLFSISETTARHFGATLRQVDPVFRDVLLLFHTDMEQVFFLNASLLHDRHTEALSETPWTSFLYLTSDPQGVPGNPTEIHAACQMILDGWVDQSSAFHTSISSLSPPQMIALAGYLLEYPISYCPVGSNEDAFLHDIPLHVYECILIPCGSDIPRHTFMKFSCPAAGEGSSRALVDKIERRFERRLGPLQPVWGEVKVNCETKTLDRVAL